LESIEERGTSRGARRVQSKKQRPARECTSFVGRKREETKKKSRERKAARPLSLSPSRDKKNNGGKEEMVDDCLGRALRIEAQKRGV